MLVVPEEPSKETAMEFLGRVYEEIELEMDEIITVFIESEKKFQTPLFRATPLYRSIEKEGIAYES